MSRGPGPGTRAAPRRLAVPEGHGQQACCPLAARRSPTGSRHAPAPGPRPPRRSRRPTAPRAETTRGRAGERAPTGGARARRGRGRRSPDRAPRPPSTGSQGRGPGGGADRRAGRRLERISRQARDETRRRAGGRRGTPRSPRPPSPRRSRPSRAQVAEATGTRHAPREARREHPGGRGVEIDLVAEAQRVARDALVPGLARDTSPRVSSVRRPANWRLA